VLIRCRKDDGANFDDDDSGVDYDIVDGNGDVGNRIDKW